MERSTSLFSPEKSNFAVSSQCLLYGKEIKCGEKKQTFLDTTSWTNLERNAKRSKIDIKEDDRLLHFRHTYSIVFQKDVFRQVILYYFFIRNSVRVFFRCFLNSNIKKIFGSNP